MSDRVCTEVVAFEWCSCVYESGFSIVSLHKTMKSAFKEMTGTANRKWQEVRRSQLMYGKGNYDPLIHERWRVRRIIVND